MTKPAVWGRSAVWGGAALLGAAGASGSVPGWPRWLAVVLLVLAVTAFGLAWRWRPRTPSPPPPPPLEGGAWWADPVLESPADDAVGREPFVTRVAELLRAIDTAEDSTVLGLVGPWGSGKSTTLRWVRDRLDTTERWTVVDMGAWAAPGPDGVVLELLRALNEAWSGTRWRRFLRTVSPTARALASASAPAASLLEPVPGVGPLLARLGWAALLPSATAPPIPQQLRALEARVGQRTRSTLVLVDDVDRLQPDELLALFKAVRVLGALPRVHYLLVYDEETVLHQLQQTAVGRQKGGGAERATAFLEKIVTLRLDQPPASRDHAEALLRSDLTAAFAAMGVELNAGTWERLDTEIGAFFVPLLSTPRAVRRFTAQLRTYLPLVRVEAVDVVDFAVLALLRIRYQALYDHLARDRYVLTARSGRAALTPEWDDGSVVERTTRRDAPLVSGALDRLFPTTLGQATTSEGQNRSRRPWRSPRSGPAAPRVHDLDYVDRFFHLAPPVNDDDEPAVLRAVQEWHLRAPGEAWARLAALVSAADASARASQRAARLLRRAATVTAHLRPAEHGAVVQMVFALFPVPEGPSDGDDAAGAARQWLRDALERADLTPEEVLHIAAPVSPADPSDIPRLQALADVLLDHRPRLHDADGLTTDLVEAAWRCVEETARRGDAGPPVSTGTLLQAVDQLAPGQLDARALAAVHAPRPGPNSLDVLDVMTCWVSVDGGPSHTTEGVLRDVVRMVGVTAATAAVDMEPDRSAGPWSAQRWTTRRLVRTVLRRADGFPDLPRGVEPVQGPLLGAPDLLHRNSLFQEPDLRMVLSVLSPSVAGDNPVRDTPSSWDDAFASLTEDDAVTRWLTSAAPAWERSDQLWTPRQERPPLLEAEAWLEGFAPDPVRPWVREPVSTAVQLTRVPVGGPSGPGGLRWTVDVGFWLRDLDRFRRPAEAASQVPEVGPVAAALEPADLEAAGTAAVAWVLDAHEAVQQLMSDDERERDLHLEARFSGRLTLRQAVRWQGLRWRAGPQSTSASVPLLVQPTAVPVAREQSARIARHLLGEWRRHTGGDRADT